MIAENQFHPLNYKTQEHIFDEHVSGQVRYLTYPLLEQTGMVKHAFSTREGGVSTGCYSSMNFSISQGDESELVKENFIRFGEAISIPAEHMVCSQQTHTTNVREVGKQDWGKGVLISRGYQDVDGLVTNEPEVCLVTSYADCVPLFFVDPVHKAIGLSHSGWRGTVGHMGAVTLEKMKKLYGTEAKDVFAAIGPSICQECYEVSEDVILRFRQAFSKAKWSDLYYQKDNGKYQLNLWKANEFVLTEAGIPRQQIAITNLCTCCNPEILYSHRASHGKRGALCGFLMIK